MLVAATHLLLKFWQQTVFTEHVCARSCLWWIATINRLLRGVKESAKANYRLNSLCTAFSTLGSSKQIGHSPCRNSSLFTHSDKDSATWLMKADLSFVPAPSTLFALVLNFISKFCRNWYQARGSCVSIDLNKRTFDQTFTHIIINHIVSITMWGQLDCLILTLAYQLARFSHFSDGQWDMITSLFKGAFPSYPSRQDFIVGTHLFFR
jgi:hypothetical protein